MRAEAYPRSIANYNDNYRSCRERHHLLEALLKKTLGAAFKLGPLGDFALHRGPTTRSSKDIDETGKTFHVLILKTNMEIAYTPFFLRLDCTYRSEAAEQRLRAAMPSGN